MRNSRHNNALIPGGEAQLVGWSRSMLYLGFNTLPRSIVRSAGFARRWDNLDVIQLSSVPLEHLTLLNGSTTKDAGRRWTSQQTSC